MGSTYENYVIRDDRVFLDIPLSEFDDFKRAMEIVNNQRTEIDRNRITLEVTNQEYDEIKQALRALYSHRELLREKRRKAKEEREKQGEPPSRAGPKIKKEIELNRLGPKIRIIKT